MVATWTENRVGPLRVYYLSLQFVPFFRVGTSGDPIQQALNDSERRSFEQQISELVQNAETKKAEIASQKIEIRHLKEQVCDLISARYLL